MQRFFFLIALTTLVCFSAQSQSQLKKKNLPPTDGTKPNTAQLKIHRSVPAVPFSDHPFGAAPSYANPTAIDWQNPRARVQVMRDAQGKPIFWEGNLLLERSAATSPAAQGLQYAIAVHPEGLINPTQEMSVQRTETDAAGEYHIRLQQMYQGVPVYGGEWVAHTRNGVVDRMNGRYFPTPAAVTVTPQLSESAAIERVQTDLRAKLGDRFQPIIDLPTETAPYRAELFIYHPTKEGKPHLAWRVEAHPNQLRRYVYFVEAQTGELLHHYDHTCQIHVHAASKTSLSNDYLPISTLDSPSKIAVVDGPVTGTGLDLLGVQRTFGAWQVGGTHYLIDGSKPMFNTSSRIPSNPIGVLRTIDAFNTSPEVRTKFNYDDVKSNATTFSSRAGVSAHYNASLTYDYFRSRFGRNSIDGVGGNILSFVNVSEDDGKSMENAYWNGAGIFYGNGGTLFLPLARALDVAGHEISHGVIEKTANLEYQDESGALNESFADIFGAMIDSDDWKIGEDVMRSGVHSTGALRDLSNPNNGDARLGNFWQPKHVNEQYRGTEDEGGVHINSGITNHAFYLFATNSAVGKDKAEQVYYKALRDYLVRLSQFVDLRVAVMQAARELYGTAVEAAAASAFDQVGIGRSTGGNPNVLGQLPVNPGTDYILIVSNDHQNLKLATGSGQILGTLYNQGVLSRPSVTDDGTEVVFVNKNNEIVDITLTYSSTGIRPTVEVISDAPTWRNVAVSKNGRFLAAISKTPEPVIYLYDFSVNPVKSAAYTLFNPTYSRDPLRTNEVQYSDVLEFDYSNTRLMYDAYNEFTSTSGQKISYWDIAFLEFFKNSALADPNKVFISKLINGLPENTSVGNPTFAKNSPFIVAFDFIDEGAAQYDIYGANIQTGDIEILVEDNKDLGVPNYNRLDNQIIYQGPNTPTTLSIYRRAVAASKIQPAGAEQLFIQNHEWAVWFANGKRSLNVSTTQAGEPVERITLAPNPAIGYTKLSFAVESGGETYLTIVDALGRVVNQQRQIVDKGDNTLTLDVQNLPSGTYFVRMAHARWSFSLPLIK